MLKSLWRGLPHVQISFQNSKISEFFRVFFELSSFRGRFRTIGSLGFLDTTLFYKCSLIVMFLLATVWEAQLRLCVFSYLGRTDAFHQLPIFPQLIVDAVIFHYCVTCNWFLVCITGWRNLVNWASNKPTEQRLPEEKNVGLPWALPPKLSSKSLLSNKSIFPGVAKVVSANLMSRNVLKRRKVHRGY